MGWTINIFWIVTIAFSVTTIYSAMNLDIGVGEAQILSSSEGLVFSIPFFINNSGLFDISELNITTCIEDYNLASSSTFVPLVSKGGEVNTMHSISILLNEIISSEYINLLFEDNYVNLDTSISLNFARVIPIKISTDTSLFWGAPFYNLSVSGVSAIAHNLTSNKAIISMNFENHSFYDLKGVMHLEIYNNMNEQVASGATDLDVPSGYRYEEQIITYLNLADVPKLTENGKVRIFFETPLFAFEWWTPYG